MEKSRELKKRKVGISNTINLILIARIGSKDKKTGTNFKISLGLVKRFQGDNQIRYIKIGVMYLLKRIEVKNQSNKRKQIHWINFSKPKLNYLKKELQMNRKVT